LNVDILTVGNFDVDILAVDNFDVDKRTSHLLALYLSRRLRIQDK
jgi:hypothetical protein